SSRGVWWVFAAAGGGAPSAAPSGSPATCPTRTRRAPRPGSPPPVSPPTPASPPFRRRSQTWFSPGEQLGTAVDNFPIDSRAFPAYEAPMHDADARAYQIRILSGVA